MYGHTNDESALISGPLPFCFNREHIRIVGKIKLYELFSFVQCRLSFVSLFPFVVVLFFSFTTDRYICYFFLLKEAVESEDVALLSSYYSVKILQFLFLCFTV
ncbi:hypothetical protein AB6A40_005324 [Gnathostoma spinigerum]|uniref:Uncharacterized protein n=1 Tax=Gnathostoma spinigerum TaxID=75299 RepID=A0ABD6EQS5_9BILA